MYRLAWLLCSGCQLVFKLRDPDAGTDTGNTDAPMLEAACSKDPAMIACYDFEDPRLFDQGPRGNDLVGQSVSFEPGIEGMAVKLDAASRLDVGDARFDAGEITVDTWIKVQAPTPHEQIIIDHNMRWAFVVDTTLHLKCYALTAGLIAQSVALVPGTWHHVACTQRPAAVAIYLDGTRVLGDDTVQVQFDSTTVAIGGDSPATDSMSPLIGSLDRFRVWSRVLSQDEIRAAAGANQ